MKKNLWYMSLIFGVLSACNTEPSNKVGESCSSIADQSGKVILNNHYYKSLDNGMVLGLFQEEVLGDTLSLPHTTMMPVYPKADSASWIIDFNGQNYKIVNELLISEATLKNKDASYKVFNLTNGKELISYTYDKFDVLFPDENEKRFLGFYGNKASDKSESNLDFKDLTFGFLSYANKEGLLSQIRIDAQDPMWLGLLDISNPVIELLPIKENALSLNSGKTLYFTSTEGKDKKEVNFDISITFYTTDTYKPTSFMLQVRSDEIVLPKDFSNTLFHLESL